MIQHREVGSSVKLISLSIMSKNTYNIIILMFLFIFLFLGLGTFISIFITPNVLNEPEERTTLPLNNFEYDLEGAVIDLQLNSGSVIVRNFLNDTSVISDPINPGHFYLGNYVDPKIDSFATVSYVIEYIAKTQYFNIMLLAEPIAESRLAAEAHLVQQLDVDENTICEIKYMVSVPNRVNSILSGKNLGFSFCEGSVPLE